MTDDGGVEVAPTRQRYPRISLCPVCKESQRAYQRAYRERPGYRERQRASRQRVALARMKMKLEAAGYTVQQVR